MREADGVLPGPGGLGGIPSGERITATVSLSGPRGFYLDIVRTQGPRTAAAERTVLEQNHVGEGFSTKTTPEGWELNYSQRLPAGSAASTTRAQVIYREIGGKYFRCSWADVNCADPAAAEAVCRSMRAHKR